MWFSFAHCNRFCCVVLMSVTLYCCFFRFIVLLTIFSVVPAMWCSEYVSCLVTLVYVIVLDDVRSCTDATDSSGTLTNDDSYVTPLREHLSSEHEQSNLSIAGLLQLSATSDSAETAKQCMSTSRCSVCSQDQIKNTTAEDSSQTKTEPQLSDEERRFLELQRSRGAIPKCRSDHRPRSHSGNCYCIFIIKKIGKDVPDIKG